MNRPIKYRVWDKHKKQMFYSEQTISGANGYISIVEIYTGYEDPDEWKNYIFSEFTGLHDKHGKEIYEGDIVTSKEWHIPHNANIRYSNGCFWAQREIPLFEEDKSDLEIIGNIYENPELLK